MQSDLLWYRTCQQYALCRGIDWVLRGCSQVMLQNSPLCGLLFFIAIFTSAWQAGMPQVAWGCLAGTIAATASAAWFLPERSGIEAGLFGYNGCLIGAALPSFLPSTPLLWLAILFWCLLSPAFTQGLSRLLSIWRLAPLTAPFVLISWTVLLASYHFSALRIAHSPEPIFPPEDISPENIETLLHALLAGVSQVFLANNAIAGALILLGLAFSALRAMAWALLGSALALAIANLLGAESHPMNAGLYAFSAVLTAIALGCTFRPPSGHTFLICLSGIICAVMVQSAFTTLLTTSGIPALTMPFVIVTWTWQLIIMPARTD